MDDDTRQAFQEVWSAIGVLYLLHLTPTGEYPPDPDRTAKLEQLARHLRRLGYVIHFGTRGIESQDYPDDKLKRL